MNELIKIENLTVGYKNRAVLSNLNATLYEGEVVCLLGANGVGKSTMLKTIVGELPLINGRVTLSGKPINQYSNKALASAVSLVTTEKVMAGGLTVKELVALGRHPHTGFFGRLSAEDRDVVEFAINSVGIYHKISSYISELSDGERQKVMIARALAQQTPIIILDEPFSFLDTAGRIEILGLLKKIAETENVGILMSSHDVSQAIRMADRLWILTASKQFVCGSPDELIKSGDISKLFNVGGIKFDFVQNDFVSYTE